MNLDNKKFKQSNTLIKLTHKMNTMELKLFFFACTVRNEGDEYIEVPFSTVVKKLNIEKGGKQYKTLCKTMQNVITASVIGVDIGDQTYIKPIITAILNKKTRLVKIEFEKNFLFLLDNLKKNYTWIYLQEISKLDLKYSPRMYEFCKMLLGANYKSISFVWYLKDIRKFLDIYDKYPVWKDLRKYVIEPSIKEINEKSSDVSLTYDILKNRAVYGIKLKIWALPKVPSKKVVENEITQIPEEENQENFNNEKQAYLEQIDPVSTEELMQLFNELKNGTL